MVVEEKQLFDGNAEYEPIKPDEGWWAAVLANEQKIGQEDDLLETGFFAESQSDDRNQPVEKVNWEKAKRIFSQDEIVNLSVVGHNRGGVLVDGEDIRGFVPASHLIEIPADLPESQREKEMMTYLDRKIDVKIIECNPDKERIVFSERAALAKKGQRKHLLCHLNPGDKVKGCVTNITSFGVFVDLGGLEGLIHISELSWGRVNHPSNTVRIGQEVEVIVLQVAEAQGRIALSLKQLKDNPWEIVSRNLDPGDVVDAVISNIVHYGAFARLEAGIEGLIHISTMKFPDGCHKVDDFLYEGQSVRVCLLHIEPEKRRLGLILESSMD